MARRIAVPEEVTARRLLERVDYQDAFTIDVDQERTAEQWVRLALKGAPPGLPALVRAVQQALGLRLHQPSPEHPLGWTVQHSDAEVFILGADGPAGTARIVAESPPGRLVVTTQLQLDHARGRLGWLVVAPLHRLVARQLLATARREGSREG